MAYNIDLQELIEKIEETLFSPKKRRKGYSLLLVEKVELELQVAITSNFDGDLNISVLQIGQGIEDLTERGVDKYHVVKITLSPTLSKEELKASLQENARLSRSVEEATVAALYKGSLLGEPE